MCSGTPVCSTERFISSLRKQKALHIGSGLKTIISKEPRIRQLRHQQIAT